MTLLRAGCPEVAQSLGHGGGLAMVDGGIIASGQPARGTAFASAGPVLGAEMVSRLEPSEPSQIPENQS